MNYNYDDVDRHPPWEYKGYKYVPQKDYEEDNVKIFHDVITPDGKRTHIAWSPYSHPSSEDLKLWIDMGCPEGGLFGILGGSNFTHESLERLWCSSKQFITEG